VFCALWHGWRWGHGTHADDGTLIALIFTISLIWFQGAGACSCVRTSSKQHRTTKPHRTSRRSHPFSLGEGEGGCGRGEAGAHWGRL